MDFLAVLGSVNIISVVFFVITLLVLGYELYLYRKEKRKKEKPKIPTFNQDKSAAPATLITAPIVEAKRKGVKKGKNLVVVITSVAVVLFGTVSFIALRNITSEPEPVPPVRTQASDPTPTIEASSSALQDLFITPTIGATDAAIANIGISPSPTVGATLAATLVSPTATTGGALGGAQTTPTVATSPTEIILAQSGATLTPTTSDAEPTEPQTLLQSGVAQPQFFIFALGFLTILISILY